MTEEIIIDGVDVAECRYFNKETDYSGCGQICKNTPCEYKLQRLKAENEELKKEIFDLNFYIDSYRQTWELDKYKQALEDVKEIINFRFKTAYMTFGYKEYAKLIKDIEKVVNEVTKMSIEEEFFKTFGIEPKNNWWCKRIDETGIADCNGIKNSSVECVKCKNGYIKNTEYSPITDRILLELICILAKNMEICSIKDINIKDLKNNILHRAINLKEIIKHQVRSLFEGVEE